MKKTMIKSICAAALLLTATACSTQEEIASPNPDDWSVAFSRSGGDATFEGGVRIIGFDENAIRIFSGVYDPSSNSWTDGSPSWGEYTSLNLLALCPATATEPTTITHNGTAAPLMGYLHNHGKTDVTFNLVHPDAQMVVHIKLQGGNANTTPRSVTAKLYQKGQINFGTNNTITVTNLASPIACGLGSFTYQSTKEDANQYEYRNTAQVVVPQTVAAGTEKFITFQIVTGNSSGGTHTTTYSFKPEKAIELKANKINHIYLGVTYANVVNLDKIVLEDWNTIEGNGSFTAPITGGASFGDNTDDNTLSNLILHYQEKAETENVWKTYTFPSANMSFSDGKYTFSTGNANNPAETDLYWQNVKADNGQKFYLTVTRQEENMGDQKDELWAEATIENNSRELKFSELKSRYAKFTLVVKAPEGKTFNPTRLNATVSNYPSITDNATTIGKLGKPTAQTTGGSTTYIISGYGKSETPSSSETGTIYVAPHAIDENNKTLTLTYNGTNYTVDLSKITIDGSEVPFAYNANQHLTLNVTLTLATGLTLGNVTVSGFDIDNTEHNFDGEYTPPTTTSGNE